MINQDFLKKSILKSLNASAQAAASVIMLLPKDSFKESALYSRRTIGGLAAHMACVPVEEIRLMKGVSRKTITKSFPKSIASPRQFENLLNRSLDYLKKEIKGVDLEGLYRSREGLILNGFEWLMQLLAHFTNHRSQLYLNLVSFKIVPSRLLLKSFFEGHPMMPIDDYKQLVASIKTHADIRKNS
jgi:hypothetical protein